MGYPFDSLIEPYAYYSGSNRLLSRQRKDLLGNDTTHLYSYNANGAQTRQVRSYDTPWESRILHREEYGYSFRGLMNRASVQTAVDGVMQPLQQWRYRYNAMGEREQKRLYGSAGGVVPAPDSARYPWVYYLLGGNKQQLAVYHGQHLDSLQRECGDGGVNRVYLYAHEYLSYGVNDVAMVLTRASGKQEYKVVDHLGSTRVVLDDNGEEIGSYDREPFGGAIAVRGVKSRKGFIDKEVDRETNTANHGVRQYDAEAGGRFRSPDAAWESFRGWSTYQYSRNNPVNRLDANGLWDITVFADDDRTKNNGLGTAVVTDRKGNVVFTFQIKVLGQHRDRMKTDGDTPAGAYKIREGETWRSRGDKRFFGVNPRLLLDPVAGEAKESNRTDIQLHAGRLMEKDPATGEWEANGKRLQDVNGTRGCIRTYDENLKKLKDVTDQLQENDPEELPGFLYVTGGDLKEMYPYVPETLSPATPIP